MEVIIILIVVGVTALIYYNKIVRGHNRAQRAWSDVLVYERQKAKVLDALEVQASSFKEYESDVLQKVVALRSAIGRLPQDANGEALKDVESQTRGLIGGVNIAFEAYPDLKAAGIVNNLMREIVEQQENVGAAVTIFNGSVEAFNNLVQMFPGSLVNRWINKKAVITPFSDAVASAGFDYKPNF
ncbi:LemA family protein [Pseudomonas putida]|jgi:LemA protein|uniref:LemA family protein n=1 Tax=Pseudomonas putida TaxID=303 RepID=UPI0023633906|nr:LemA family protein [Pseudomonas putida]MDD2054783.1 LemA family protein [Pseudomonas putida]